jgi:hypothetical protein
MAAAPPFCCTTIFTTFVAFISLFYESVFIMILPSTDTDDEVIVLDKDMTINDQEEELSEELTLHDVLNSHRKVSKTLKEWQELLIELMKAGVHTFSFDPSKMDEAKTLFDDLTATVRTAIALNKTPDMKSVQRRWTSAFVAASMITLDHLLSTASQSTRLPVITTFKCLIKKCRERLLSENIEIASRGNKNTMSIGKQRGRAIQDTLDWDGPACDRGFCMVVGPSNREVAAQNLEMRNEFELETAKWSYLSKKKRTGPKPKMPKTLDTRIVCMCLQMFCMLRPEGTGCVTNLNSIAAMSKSVVELAVASEHGRDISNLLFDNLKRPIRLHTMRELGTEQLAKYVLDWPVLGLVRWSRHSRKHIRWRAPLNDLSDNRRKISCEVVPNEAPLIVEVTVR